MAEPGRIISKSKSTKIIFTIRNIDWKADIKANARLNFQIGPALFSLALIRSMERQKTTEILSTRRRVSRSC